MPNDILTLHNQREGLVKFLKAIPGIGTVYPYRRIIRDEQDVKRLLAPGGTKTVNAWQLYLSPASTTVTERNPGHAGRGIIGGGNVLTTFQWQVEGYYAIDDAAGSENIFGDLAWSVADTINAVGLLDIDGLVMQLPADVEQFGYVMIAGQFLFHRAVIGVGLRGRTRPV